MLYNGRDYIIFMSDCAGEVDYAMHHYMEVDYVMLPKETALPDEIYENLQTAYRKIELKDYWLFEV